MKHLPLRLCVALLLLTSLGAWAGTIFKCRNSQGVVLYQEKPCEKEAEAVSSWAATSSMEIDSSAPNADNQPMVLSQGAGGHYYIDGSINDNFVNFIVDTGATTVSLPITMGQSANLKCIQQVQMKTGNGVSMGCVTMIQKLKIGSITMHSVEAVLMPNLGQPLLGMNVLKQFRVEQENGQMRLLRKY